MLTTYVRVMDEYRRKIRLELLNARISDRRDPQEVLTWTRDRNHDRA